MKNNKCRSGDKLRLKSDQSWFDAGDIRELKGEEPAYGFKTRSTCQSHLR